jgi:glutamate N-acetyltransferase/amino-acid N-acetyltransferase
MNPIVIDRNGSITTPAGFTAGALHAGLRPVSEPDLAILLSETPCSGAGVFTTNKVRAAPVVYDEQLLLERPGRLRAVVMNAQIANACTGEVGLADATLMAERTESTLKLPGRTCLVLSTGVIGVPLPMEKVTTGIRELADRLDRDGGVPTARAIMTTDTRPKHLSISFETPGGTVSVGGVAKGSGMIHPNMATMLGLITTDAKVDPARLSSLLKEIADRTFNAITVDGDTSTNDSVLILANGASKVDVTRDPKAWASFAEAVEKVARELAHEIVRDGEGATRFVELKVSGATTESSARMIGRSVARSALVKTALFGADANWGRILSATGASGQPMNAERLTLRARKRPTDDDENPEWLDLARDGETATPSEEVMAEIFQSQEIALHLDVGVGGAESTVWTCDLSTEYVKINANYRT